jgi:two-component system, cell cycle sensor histidine kinase and response regulator CckA
MPVLADSTRIRLPDCFAYHRFSKPQPFIGLNVAMESRIIRFIKNILLLGIFKSRADYEDSRKLVLINTICLTAIVVLVLIGSVSLYRGNTMVSLLDMLTAVLLTGCLFYLRRTGKQRAPLRIGIGIMTLLYYYMFFSGGADHTGFLWYYTYPVFTLYLMQRRDGVIANLILIVPSFVYLLTIWPDETAPYSQDFTLRFIPSMLCVLIFSYLFEATRSKTHSNLEAKQQELKDTIHALREKETELKSAHDDLELRIQERTLQLQRSNLKLKTEIEERKRSETQRRKLETRLARAQKMEALGTLAGAVAHDLNNILSGISTYPELLLMKVSQDNPLYDPLRTVQVSGEKAARIVQDLLTLSRRGVTVFDTVDLKQIVQDYADSPEFKKMISYHRAVWYETTFSSGDFTISGSADHLSKIIMNLVTNAAEAMPSGGCITIGLQRVAIPEENQDTVLEPGVYVQLTVADTGSGIAAEDIERIFEPFFTTKKMGRSGSGLGMAIVWGAVQDHNGHIEVRSLPGKGTTFELLFPAVSRKQTERAEVPVNHRLGNRESILVVDDLEVQREVATDILQMLKYSVESVPSGEAAVDYLRECEVDLVLLDMTMEPGINGLETFRRILRIRPDQRVIIASGFSETDLIRESLDLGARAYLKKPYSLETISRAIADALGGKKQN